MDFRTFFSRQAERPSGVFGRFVASLIFDKGNVDLNRFVFESLEIDAQDQLLEIGFGTGKLMSEIAPRLDGGSITGIDFSETMVALAEKKNRVHINAGRVKIVAGNFQRVAFEESAFDKVFTVNTVYFWKNPIDTVSTMHRILKSGGKALIGFHAKADMAKKKLDRDVFRFYSPDDMIDLLATRWPGDRIDIIRRKRRAMSCYCAVATK